MLLVRVHPNPRPLKFILVGRLTAFRFLTRSSYLQAHRAWPRSDFTLGGLVLLLPTSVIASRSVFLLPRHGFPHCRQKDYLSASGWGEGKLLLVSGFEPDPTSIVSPSSFVALPLGAFLRQAANDQSLKDIIFVNLGRVRIFRLALYRAISHQFHQHKVCSPSRHAVSARSLTLRASSVGFRRTKLLSKNYYNIPRKHPFVKRFFNFF